MTRISTLLAGLAAVVAFGALVLQAVLIVHTMREGGAGAAAALWRFFGFFTIRARLSARVLSLRHSARHD